VGTGDGTKFLSQGTGSFALELTGGGGGGFGGSSVEESVGDWKKGKNKIKNGPFPFVEKSKRGGDIVEIRGGATKFDITRDKVPVKRSGFLSCWHGGGKGHRRGGNGVRPSKSQTKVLVKKGEGK